MTQSEKRLLLLAIPLFLLLLAVWLATSTAQIEGHDLHNMAPLPDIEEELEVVPYNPNDAPLYVPIEQPELEEENPPPKETREEEIARREAEAHGRVSWYDGPDGYKNKSLREALIAVASEITSEQSQQIYEAVRAADDTRKRAHEMANEDPNLQGEEVFFAMREADAEYDRVFDASMYHFVHDWIGIAEWRKIQARIIFPKQETKK